VNTRVAVIARPSTLRWSVQQLADKSGVSIAPTSSVAQSSRAEILDRVIGIAPAPLLPGEVEADYVDVASRIVAVAQPRDAIEEFLTRVVDGISEILRLCRLKAGLLRISCSDGVRSVASKLGYKLTSMGTVHDLSVKWMSGDAAARDQYDKMLSKAALGWNTSWLRLYQARSTPSSALTVWLPAPRRVATTPCARYRHRSTFGAAVRQAIDKVEDVEFRDVETGEVSGGRRLDHRPRTPRQSCEREIEHRAEDRIRKGSVRAKRVASWFERLNTIGPRASAAGGGNGA
jgi:hypothetical protein